MNRADIELRSAEWKALQTECEEADSTNANHAVVEEKKMYMPDPETTEPTNTKTRVVVLGNGYVGSRIKSFFKDQPNIDVKVYDTNMSCTNFTSIKDLNAWEADYAFIAVPTPMSEDGSCDTSIVEDMIHRVDAGVYIIRSTVSPGTTDRLARAYTAKNIVFSPEYFGETANHPLNDMSERAFHILGGSSDATALVCELYKEVYQDCIFYCVDATTAEVIKYAENAYLGTKVVFVEELKCICDAIGVDFWKVREGWLLDPRINRSHTLPGKEGFAGFGGKCLPKDINAIAVASKRAGYYPHFIQAVLDNNDRLQRGD